MTVELLLPGRRIPAPKPPSRIVLDMAFGVGAGAVLGDKSRYRSHGAITTATWAAGLHGYCLDFEGGDPDYVTIPAAHTQLDFTTENFSLIARINLESLPGTEAFFTRYAWNTNGYRLDVQANGSLRFFTFQAAANQESHGTAGDIAVGAWCTIGLSRNGASVRLFHNGVDRTSVVGVHIDPVSRTGAALLGIQPDLASDPFDGRIEFLRIFRGVELVASEHLAWHNALA